MQAIRKRSYSGNMEELAMTPESESASVPSNADDFETIFSPKPRENPVYIDDLEDAIGQTEDGQPILKTDKNGHIIIERWFKDRWLGTTFYKVLSVNLITGDMNLHDEENQQAAMANFITGPKRHGWRFKLPVPGLNLNKREAPRPQPTRVTQEPPRPQVDETGAPIAKKNGRPKGVKNRPREIIEAEKAAKHKERVAKRLAREQKRAAKLGHRIP